MDPASHVLLGVTLSEATLRPRIGRKANWLAAAAVLAADADIVANYVVADPWASLRYHRGLTHSLFLAPVFALLCAALFWLPGRRRFGALFALALLAAISHPLLDLVTSYGTQVLWPIATDRFAIDLLPIVDIFFTPILLMTVLSCWLIRRFRRSDDQAADIVPAGSSPAPPAGRAARWPQSAAQIGLALMIGYLSLGAWIHRQTVQLVWRTAPGDHDSVREASSYPMVGTIFARRLVARTGEGFYVARHNWLLSRSQPEWTWARNGSGPAVEQADKLDGIAIFRWFAMGMARPLVEQANDGDGQAMVRVTYHDMRYGFPADSTESIFRAYVIVDARTGRVRAGPAPMRWGDPQASAEGLAAFFQSPNDSPPRPVGLWQRAGQLWREAWQP